MEIDTIMEIVLAMLLGWTTRGEIMMHRLDKTLAVLAGKVDSIKTYTPPCDFYTELERKHQKLEQEHGILQERVKNLMEAVGRDGTKES